MHFPFFILACKCFILNKVSQHSRVFFLESFLSKLDWTAATFFIFLYYSPNLLLCASLAAFISLSLKCRVWQKKKLLAFIKSRGREFLKNKKKNKVFLYYWVQNLSLHNQEENTTKNREGKKKAFLMIDSNTWSSAMQLSIDLGKLYISNCCASTLYR